MQHRLLRFLGPGFVLLAIASCSRERDMHKHVQPRERPIASAGDPIAPNPSDSARHDAAPVALLFGRVVRAVDRRTSPGKIVEVSFSDPSETTFAELNRDLDEACERQIDSSARRPEADEPRCGALGAHATQRRLCRARAAQAFSAAGHDRGIARDQRGVVLDTMGEHPAVSQRWTILSDELTSQASWALFRVAELREAVALVVDALDLARCPADTAEAVAGPLAEALADAVEQLPLATREADDLLRRRLQEIGAAGPIDAVLHTRALTDSLLERLKLYAAIPMGSFEPGDANDAADAGERLPVGPRAPSPASAKVVVLMAATSAPVLDVDGRPQPDWDERWFGALRERDPLGFGSYGANDKARALANLGIGAEQLADGVTWLSQAVRVAGTALQSIRLDAQSELVTGLQRLSNEPVSGYPYAISEARAALAPGEGELARRGLAHALLAAGRAARRASERTELRVATSVWQRLSARHAAPIGRVCRAVPDDLSLEILDLDPESAGGHYALARGRSAAACLVQTPSTCMAFDHSPGEWDPEREVLRFKAMREPQRSDELYLIDMADPAAPEIVAAASLTPFASPASEDEHCHLLPLSADLQHDLLRVFRDDVLPQLLRTPALPDTRLSATWDAETPTPPLLGQRLSLEPADTRPLDLAQPLSTRRIEIDEALRMACALPEWTAQTSCESGSLAVARDAACIAEGLRTALEDGSSAALPNLPLEDAAQRVALLAWELEARTRALALLARAISNWSCADELSSADSESALWAHLTDSAQTLLSDHRQLRAALAALPPPASATSEEQARLLARRGIIGSPLAMARWMLAIPHGLYEPEGETVASSLGDALARFPATHRPADSAEDERAESLLRTSALHPLWNTERVVADSAQLETLWRSDPFALALRTLLVRAAPDLYAQTPDGADTFLSAVGTTREQLANAAGRVLQTAEARGDALLGRAQTAPVETVYEEAEAPSPWHLYALTEGRADLTTSAHELSFALRGPYHALAYAAACMQRRAESAAWTVTERQLHLDQIAVVTKLTGPRAVELRLEHADGASAVALVLHDGLAASDDALRGRYEVWWTEAGLICAKTGQLGGTACDEREFLVSAERARVVRRSDTVELAGLEWPTPRSWNPDSDGSRLRGRLYVTERDADGKRRERVSAALGRGDADRRLGFMSDGLAAELRELLGYEAAAEDCRSCVPTSVCQEAECIQGRCARAPVTGHSCGAHAMCVAGACEAPGCGDGVRSDGSGTEPYEPCDDGNQQNGDGCSSRCELERRAIEPLVAEVYPGGSAPVVGVDGQGRSLLVFASDALDGDSTSLQALRFDAFGARSGVTITLASNIPRQFLIEPSVAGLQKGGFVVAYTAPGDAGGTHFQLIGRDGQMGPLTQVEPSAVLQHGARVAPQQDGFVVVWSERDAARPRGRVRIKRFDAGGRALYGPADLTPPSDDVDQTAPALAASNDQVLVVWNERSVASGLSQGLRLQRVDTRGQHLDGAGFSLIAGDATDPSVTTRDDGDYVVAWTDRRQDARGDVWSRRVKRFGSPASTGPGQPVVATEAAEQAPVVAAGRDTALLLGYERGAPSGATILVGSQLDEASLAAAQSMLQRARSHDLSLTRATQGIWAVWSEPSMQGLSLFALLLPHAAPTTSALPALSVWR